MGRRPRPSLRWLLVAAVTALIPASLTLFRGGECRDAIDPALSACDGGFASGEGGVVAVWAVWALFALWCIGRALRPRRRRSTRAAPGPAPDGSTPRIGAHTAVLLPRPGRGEVQLAYAPRRDGRPDTGEIVWGWVPFEEDPTRGKDRPLLIIAEFDTQHVLAMKLTSRSHDGDRDHVGIGMGPWDTRGRASWVDIDQVYRVHRSGIRREAGALPRTTFDRVARVLTRRYGWMPPA